MKDHVLLNIRMYASKRDKIMEDVILNLGWEWYSAKKAYEYARNVLKKRWRKAEYKIKACPHYAYLYARHVIKGRWIEAEENIAKQEAASYLYAKYVIKGRFELGEASFRSPREIYWYSKYVLKSRWKQKEKILHKNTNTYDAEHLIKYCIEIRKDRWPAIEDLVLNSRHIGKYMSSLKKQSDHEEFYNKVLIQSLVESTNKWTPNYARDHIVLQK